MAGAFYCGTSSWTAEGWEKAFYPPGMRPGDYLGYYATRYRTVEADVTYYDLVTTDFAYARLIGDRKAVEARTKTFDRTVLDQGPRIARWADLLRSLMERVPEVFAYANNHYEGNAPDTVEALATAVKESQ